MKKIINTHSFVDVITNSSTEIFICDGSKSAEMMTLLLREKCEQTNNMDQFNRELTISGHKEGVEIYSFLN